MENYDKGENGTPGNPPDDESDFLQDFIERKKLQNRVLRELLEKLKQTENENKSEPTTNKQKP